MFELIFRHFWLLALGIGLLNYFMIKRRIRPLIDENPDLEPGYERLLTWFLLFLTLPWIIAGTAILSGAAASLFDILSPHSGNWFVQIFWVCIVTLCVGPMGWVVFGSGAEFLEQHPGVVRINFPGVDPQKPTARQIRRAMIFFLIISVFVFGMFLSGMSPPFPKGELPPTPPR